MLPKLRPFNRIKPRLQKQPGHIARIKAMGCLVCGFNPVDAHHVRTGLKPRDDARIVPLCREHHQGRTGFHGLGSEAEFVRVHAISLVDEAEKLARESAMMGILR